VIVHHRDRDRFNHPSRLWTVTVTVETVERKIHCISVYESIFKNLFGIETKSIKVNFELFKVNFEKFKEHCDQTYSNPFVFEA
jgi:hypothetical protein